MDISLVWKRLKCCILATIALSTTGFAAAEYRITKGNQYELCQGFVDYLNRHPEGALICELKPDKEFRDFRLPEWNYLDPKEYESSILERLQFAHNKKGKKIDDLIRRYKERISSGDLKLKSAKFDLNHDSFLDHVFSYNPLNCTLNSKNSSELNYVVTDTGDFYKQMGGGVRGMAFFFKGRVFLANGGPFYSISEPNQWHFGKSKRSSIPWNQVCEFRIAKEGKD